MTFVELFFDLVFVFAITSTTRLLLGDLTWTGVGRSFLILWLVWWAWTQFTWSLNPADTNHHAVRLITLAASASAFFMAQAIPEAWTTAGAWFGIAYVIVRILGLGLQLRLMVGIRENAKTVLMWVSGSSIGMVAVLIGGLLVSPWREIFWTAAVAVDLVSALRAGEGNWKLDAAHFSERHGLIVIIALGESLIAAGVALGEVPRGVTFATGTLTAVVAVCALWWLYFAIAKDDLEEHLAAQPPENVGHAARNVYSWAHLPIIAGIIAFAVAVEQILSHVNDPIGRPALLGLVAAVVLYLGGIVYGLRQSGRHPIAPWLVTVILAVSAVLVSAGTGTGLTPLIVVTVVLVLFAAWGFWSDRVTNLVKDGE